MSGGAGVLLPLPSREDALGAPDRGRVGDVGDHQARRPAAVRPLRAHRSHARGVGALPARRGHDRPAPARPAAQRDAGTRGRR
eukprot:13989993-Alexandrium_andersonii.AAC.1